MLCRKIVVFRIFRYLTTSTKAKTVDTAEIEHFKKYTHQWWDPEGPVKALHSMNQVRIPFIRDGLVKACNIDAGGDLQMGQPLKGLDILDIGCGGGILSEPLSRLGANVTGIDANEDIIKSAQKRAQIKKLRNVSYLYCTVEEHCLQNKEKYDAVVASEVLDHISEKEIFLEASLKCLKPSGSIFITTINRTVIARLAVICLAENVFNLIPKGTHDIEKFIKPEEVEKTLEENYNCRNKSIDGFFYNPLTNSWSVCVNKSIHYGLHAVKL